MQVISSSTVCIGVVHKEAKRNHDVTALLLVEWKADHFLQKHQSMRMRENKTTMREHRTTRSNSKSLSIGKKNTRTERG